MLKEKCESKVKLYTNDAHEESDAVIPKLKPQKKPLAVSHASDATNTLQSENKNTNRQSSDQQKCQDASKNNKKRNTIITGSANEDNSFGAAEKKAWLYVGRAKADTKAEHVKTYLEAKFPNYKNNFIVESIKNVNKNTYVNNMSFKVGVSFSLLDDITKPEIWPNNIIVRRFNFRSNKGNFMQAPATRNLK